VATAGRKRCACRRVLLQLGGVPLIEATGTVDRVRHTLAACEPYRLLARRVPPATGARSA
jgi:hypothetical protein